MKKNISQPWEDVIEVFRSTGQQLYENGINCAYGINDLSMYGKICDLQFNYLKDEVLTIAAIGFGNCTDQSIHIRTSHGPYWELDADKENILEESVIKVDDLRNEKIGMTDIADICWNQIKMHIGYDRAQLQP